MNKGENMPNDLQVIVWEKQYLPLPPNQTKITILLVCVHARNTCAVRRLKNTGRNFISDISTSDLGSKYKYSKSER